MAWAIQAMVQGGRGRPRRFQARTDHGPQARLPAAWSAAVPVENTAILSHMSIPCPGVTCEAAGYKKKTGHVREGDMVEDVYPMPRGNLCFSRIKAAGYKKKTGHVREGDMVEEVLKVLAGKGELS